MFVLFGVYGFGEIINCEGIKWDMLFKVSVLFCIILMLMLSLVKYWVRLWVNELKLLINSNIVVLVFGIFKLWRF